ncbi:MAG: TM0996/MTH895 family glutaredoxin-like protein [Candidatus Omnitrophica bacterium]|nr:TM0996/MTH895 family glutaredoxin-like protein [Candidatus Omnitrophota bacterium]
MKIEVFGPGCPKCVKLEQTVRDAVASTGMIADVEKVKDVMKIAEAGIMMMPGLRINGKVKCTGRIPNPEEIKKWIEEER